MTARPVPNFSDYCEAACIKLWGEPSERDDKELRWSGGRIFTIEKKAWYDFVQACGGSTLELVAYSKGLPKQALKGAAFFETWGEAYKMGLVPDPPPPAKGKSSAKQWSPVVARYVYRKADGAPHLQVCRTAGKDFFQNKWNGQMWVAGKPDGPKIPYRLPELLAAPLTTKVHVAEGEKDADALAKLNFVATTNSEGAGNWTDDLNEYFRDRHVYIHEDNDDAGRKRVQRIARALDPIAASVRIVRLPGLEQKGDVSDWLKSDPSGAKLVRECESAPLWEPSATPTTEEEDTDDPPPVKQTKKQADILIELASSAELFRDRDDVGYGRFEVNDHKENWSLRSKGFKHWLTRSFYESTQSAPSAEAMQQALGVLEARARFDAPEHEVCVRVAGHEGRIYIDLCDPDWRVIEVDTDGWRVIDDPPVYFRRAAGMLPLPDPVHGGNINELRPFVNVANDDEFVLVVAYDLATFCPRGPYPVLDPSGEHGAAKTTLSDIVRKLIDPNSVMRDGLPGDERDLAIAVKNQHCPSFDNVSNLPDWLSDALARTSTGAGFRTRELWSNDEEALFNGSRPIILNGINDVVLRGDLADRAVKLVLKPIDEKKRKTEDEFWGDFEPAYPRILGALLDGVAHGLRQLPNTRLSKKPRMADFALWATACETAYWETGTFIKAYDQNREHAVATVIEADHVATALAWPRERNGTEPRRCFWMNWKR